MVLSSLQTIQKINISEEMFCKNQYLYFCVFLFCKLHKFLNTFMQISIMILKSAYQSYFENTVNRNIEDETEKSGSDLSNLILMSDKELKKKNIRFCY